jgi:hypothetical protein
MVTSYRVSDTPLADAQQYQQQQQQQSIVGSRGSSLYYVRGGCVIVTRPDGTAVRFEPKEFQR